MLVDIEEKLSKIQGTTDATLKMLESQIEDEVKVLESAMKAESVSLRSSFDARIGSVQKDFAYAGEEIIELVRSVDESVEQRAETVYNQQQKEQLEELKKKGMMMVMKDRSSKTFLMLIFSFLLDFFCILPLLHEL